MHARGRLVGARGAMCKGRGGALCCPPAPRQRCTCGNLLPSSWQPSALPPLLGAAAAASHTTATPQRPWAALLHIEASAVAGSVGVGEHSSYKAARQPGDEHSAGWVRARSVDVTKRAHFASAQPQTPCPRALAFPCCQLNAAAVAPGTLPGPWRKPRR